jgi:hypothetical protein
MGVSRVRRDHTILFAGEFSWVIRRNESFNLLLLHLHIFLLLLNSHNETPVSSQLCLRFRLSHIILLLITINFGMGSRRLRMRSFVSLLSLTITRIEVMRTWGSQTLSILVLSGSLTLRLVPDSGRCPQFIYTTTVLSRLGLLRLSSLFGGVSRLIG